MTLHLVVAVIFVAVPQVLGHGRLIEPPSRASAWRYGFNTPHNYNDHELYCGGYTRQWQNNGGKCGVCGDAWDGRLPRPHEYGGTYGQGVIVRNYGVGNVVTIRVELTASHMGHFTFTICDDYKNATQECLDKHTLKIIRPQENVDRSDVRYYPKDGNKVYEMKYRLPPRFSCAHCLLQWRYIAGNNWGTCDDGTGAVGCGPQEEFRACADISIGKQHATPSTPFHPKPSTDATDTTPTTTVVPPGTDETSYSPVTSLVIALVCFFIVIILLAALFIYYYKMAKQVKLWLLRKSGKKANTNGGVDYGADKPETKPPLPPPRTKRTRSVSDSHDNMQEISLEKDSLA